MQNVTIPTNGHNAENRFKSLETWLRKNANLRHVYYTHMLYYVQQGQVEVVDKDEKQEGQFYLPHHAVSKGKRETQNGKSYSTHPHMTGENPP